MDPKKRHNSKEKKRKERIGYNIRKLWALVPVEYHVTGHKEVRFPESCSSWLARPFVFWPHPIVALESGDITTNYVCSLGLRGPFCANDTRWKFITCVRKLSFRFVVFAKKASFRSGPLVLLPGTTVQDHQILSSEEHKFFLNAHSKFGSICFPFPECECSYNNCYNPGRSCPEKLFLTDARVDAGEISRLRRLSAKEVGQVSAGPGRPGTG